jgi:hypothetical protein
MLTFGSVKVRGEEWQCQTLSVSYAARHMCHITVRLIRDQHPVRVTCILLNSIQLKNFALDRVYLLSFLTL